MARGVAIDPAVRAVLRVYFDAIALAEPAQFALWQSTRLTLTQFGALRQLRSAPLAAGILAGGLGVSATSLTRILDRLEARKLIKRDRDEVDRRRISIALTPSGRQLIDSISVLEGTAIQVAVETMTEPDREHLVTSLQRLVDLARARSADPLRQETNPVMP